MTMHEPKCGACGAPAENVHRRDVQRAAAEAAAAAPPGAEQAMADQAIDAAMAEEDIAYHLVCTKRCGWEEIERYSQMAGPDDLPDDYFEE